MYVTHIADANDAIAFHAFYQLVTPALSAAARRHLQQVFHPHQDCRHAHDTHPARMCADCAAVVDDLTLDTFVRLRRAIAAHLSPDDTAQPIRELDSVAAHVCSPDAAHEPVAQASATLLGLNLRDPHAGPAWLRAAKAQLVVYPTRHLAGELRRDLAVAHHGSAKPDRDLISSAWAAPLRTSRAGLELLIAFIYRLRLGTGDPYQTPTDIRDRHHLTPGAANELLHATLRRLRQLRPDFFDANVDTPLAIASQISLATDRPPTVEDRAAAPEQRLIAQEAASHARAVLQRLINYRPGDNQTRQRRRHAYRDILLTVARALDTDTRDLVGLCAQRLGLAELAAARLLRRLVRLVADADADWVEQTLSGLAV